MFPVRASLRRHRYVQYSGDPMTSQEDDERRRYERWREDVRRKVREGYEQALRGELVDGEEAFERLRKRIEAMGKKGA